MTLDSNSRSAEQASHWRLGERENGLWVAALSVFAAVSEYEERVSGYYDCCCRYLGRGTSMA